jgi:UDP-N-acetylglucosamine/UDP-N-acetylgalactosamine 4-epimerase
MKNILITGGAGFIGSNLAEALLADDRVHKVRVLDNFATGLRKNVEEFLGHQKYEFMEGDICDPATCNRAMQDMHLVSHQAALGSVPRSIQDPVMSDKVNVGGTVNILKAAVDHSIERIILACSSSTYGDSEVLPKVEDQIGKPLSPYAVTKAAMEQYGHVFQLNYGLPYIGLRYFNVFGTRQSPDNPYAAVIPLFCKAILNNTSPVINGDGSTSRDFTYIDNAVQANILALFTENPDALNQIYNVACGEAHTLLDLHQYLCEISGRDIAPVYGPERTGDIRHSLASIQKARELLGYNPAVPFREGLKRVLSWYKSMV